MFAERSSDFERRASVVKALQLGVSTDDGLYCKRGAQLVIRNDASGSLHLWSQEGCDVGGIDTYEESWASLPTEALQQLIAQAVEFGKGRLDCEVELSQNLFGHDTSEEFDIRRETKIGLWIVVAISEENVATADIGYRPLV